MFSGWERDPSKVWFFVRFNVSLCWFVFLYEFLFCTFTFLNECGHDKFVCMCVKKKKKRGRISSNLFVKLQAPAQIKNKIPIHFFYFNACCDKISDHFY